MESKRFRRFVLLVDGIHKSVQKIKYNNAPDFGVKGVHTLWVYELLCHPEGMTASELANESMIDRSLISREIERLKEIGYIETDDNNGKRNYNTKIRLTERGREVAASIGEIAMDVQTRANAGISESDLEGFYRTLEKLNKNLAEIAEEHKD
jgi:DNA-binding MarR family transcriptional regulator